VKKVAVVYWSGAGNTEAMANLVAQDYPDDKASDRRIVLGGLLVEE
jgi:flavodoxin